jgi:hypothetical protein
MAGKKGIEGTGKHRRGPGRPKGSLGKSNQTGRPLSSSEIWRRYKERHERSEGDVLVKRVTVTMDYYGLFPWEKEKMPREVKEFSDWLEEILEEDGYNPELKSMFLEYLKVYARRVRDKFPADVLERNKDCATKFK